ADAVSRGKPSQTEVHIQVQDDGPGLPSDALRMLFDPFAPRSDSPAEYGINLMACYFIVHHHGGKIEASPGENGGTVFHIQLPTNPNAAPLIEENQEFFQKVLANDALFEKMLASN